MRILIADDHPLVRQGVKATVGQSDQFQVVGESQDSDETLKLVQSLKPDLLILDLEMPGTVTENVAQEALKLHPAMKLLVLTSRNDDKTLRKLSKVKISGYLLKDEAPENLMQALRTVSQGAAWFSQFVVQRLLSLTNEEDTHPQLTPREKMILMLMAEGKDNATIAKDLALAEQTVRNYASGIYEKIGAKSRAEAVVWAIGQGFGPKH